MVKLITLENLKTFLDKLREELDNTKESGTENFAFFEWLKKRNYDLTAYKSLESIFPVLTLPELNVPNLQKGDTVIQGTGAPHAWVMYEDKKVQISDSGNFAIKGIQPLKDKEKISISYINYADRKHYLPFYVGEITYAVPDEVTEISTKEVSQYKLNRAGKLIFPNSVKKVDNGAFTNCGNLTTVELPGCTYVDTWAFSSCGNLTTVELPNCTYVDPLAFAWCNSLKELIINGQVNISKPFWSQVPFTCTIYNETKTKKLVNGKWETV